MISTDSAASLLVESGGTGAATFDAKPLANAAKLTLQEGTQTFELVKRDHFASEPTQWTS